MDEKEGLGKDSSALLNLTRRQFLRNSATAGALALTGAALSGCVENLALAEELSADEVPIGAVSPVTFEGCGADSIIPEGVPAQWDQEVDIIIVGLGGGGMMASLKAAEAGVKVLSLDKAPHYGGSTQEATTFAIHKGTNDGNPLISSVDEIMVPEDIEAAVDVQVGQAHNSADRDLIRALVVGGPEFIHWLGDDYGMPWGIETTYRDGLTYDDATKDLFIPRAAKLVLDFVYPLAVEKGVEFQFNTTVVNLIKEGNRIVGVKARKLDNSHVYYKANKAVILTAGGMMNNKDLLRKYCPTALECCLATMANTTDTGEVIRMALGAGAQFAGWDSFNTFDGATDWKHWSHYLYQGDVQLIRQPWLGFDITGKRYPYFDSRSMAMGAGSLLFQGQVLQSLPGHRGFIVFDSNYEEIAPKFGQLFCRKLITPDMYGIDRMPDEVGAHDWRVGVKRAIEDGVFKKADSLEELAALVGVEKDIFVEAVQNWNRICAAGVDDELGFPEDFLYPVDSPPYYSCPVGSYPMATQSGAKVNANLQVVGVNGKVIEGLYAGGMTAGGTTGESNYGVGCQPLGTVNMTCTMGYLAARNALAANV